MSYLTLATTGKFNLTIVAGIISVILPNINIFQYKADYSRRSSSYKECYLRLETLESECKLLISKYKNKQIDSEEYMRNEEHIHTQYNEILSLCENHTDYDYYIFRKNQLENKNEFFSISVKEIIKYNVIKFFVIFIIGIIIITPIIFISLKIFS